MVKTVFSFFFIFLSPAIAKDFGVHGSISVIEEEDPIRLIQQKLKGMEERGELDQHKRDLQKKTKAAVERPKPVEGISAAHETRIFYYDPTYVVPADIKDHLGQLIHQKDTRINLLETVSLSQELVFFDGDDSDQVAWVQTRKEPARLILVKGAPLALSEKLGVPVYFDQAGLLSKKLGITHVPAVVTQQGLRLRIEEYAMKHLSIKSEGP